MINRILAGLVLACLATLSLAGAVAAHAELVESDPPDGGTIETPYTLVATFDEEMLEERSGIVVRDAAGDEVARGPVDPDDRTRMVAELPELEPGEYVARWTARTADGHTERGEFSFTVSAAATPEPTAAPTATPVATATASATAAPTGAPTSAPSPTPPASPSPVEPAPSADSDVLLALILAAVAIGAVIAFVFLRNRR